MFSEIAYAGVLTAFTLVFIYIAGVFPGGRLSILCLTTAVGAFVLMDTHFRFWLVHYAAAALLGLLVAPNVLIALPYVLIFGNYAAIKYACECMRNRVLEYACKCVYFAGMGYLTYSICKSVLLSDNMIDIAWYIVLPISIGIGVLFDFALTGVIKLYSSRIRNWIRK